MSKRRAQVSLEVMLLLASLLAFFIALAPGIDKVAAVSEYAMKEKQMEFCFEKIIASVEEAGALGLGSVLRNEIYFPVECEMEYSEGKLKLQYEISGREGTLGENFGQKILFERIKLQKGRHEMIVESAKGGIKLGFEPEKS
ncbi:MAG: hypothetical protein V1835_02930 [Candidatus Micrarchaeota archaeon]